MAHSHGPVHICPDGRSRRYPGTACHSSRNLHFVGSLNQPSPGKHNRVTPGFFTKCRIISKALKKDALACVAHPGPNCVLVAKFLLYADRSQSRSYRIFQRRFICHHCRPDPHPFFVVVADFHSCFHSTGMVAVSNQSLMS